MRIRYYGTDNMFIDEFKTKDGFINLGGKGSVCILHDIIYKIEEIIPFTKFSDNTTKQEYIRVIVNRIG